MIVSNDRPSCPCCGSHILLDADLIFNEEARTLTGRGYALALSLHRSRIFAALWKNRKTGRLIHPNEMMSIVYAHDPNGGPESENIISVQIGHLRKALAPFGLSIKGRNGYSLVSVPKEKERAA